MKLGAPFCLSSSKAAGGRCLFDKVRKVVGRPAVGRAASWPASFRRHVPNLFCVRSWISTCRRALTLLL